MQKKTQRRSFIKRMSAGTVAGLFTMGKGTSTVLGANDALRIGCIGTGGRCRRLMRDLAHIPNVRITAVCDIWDNHLAEAKKHADPKATATKEYRDVLDDKNLDAVLIATPDHWHVPITIDACEAGKDVYVEKPLTHDLTEGQSVIDAQNKNKRIVQVGMQQRSMPHIQKAFEILKSGILGKIHKVHLTWNRNHPTTRKHQYGIDPKTVDWKKFLGSAKDQSFDEFRFRNWRWFWDFGGGILTDLMVHYLDVAHWFCDVDHPSTAQTIGDHVTTAGIWETPDTIQTLLHYPDKKLQIYFEGTFINARNGAMMEFMGRDATLYMDRGRYEIYPESDKVQYQELILGQGKRGADFYSTPNGGLLHLTNWIECIKSRKTPNAPAEAGVSAASGAHLGNQSYLTAQTALWDA